MPPKSYTPEQRRADYLHRRDAKRAAEAAKAHDLAARTVILAVTDTELAILLCGLGLEMDRWRQRAGTAERNYDVPVFHDAVDRARAADELRVKLMRHQKRGVKARPAGESFENARRITP